MIWRLELLYQSVHEDAYNAICDRLEDEQLPYINALGRVEFPYIKTEKSREVKRVIARFDNYQSDSSLWSTPLLPDIFKRKLLDDDDSERGYDSGGSRVPTKILRLNDAFKIQSSPSLSNSQSMQNLSKSSFRKSLVAQWSSELKNLEEEDKVTEAIAKLKSKKYFAKEKNMTLTELLK
jgi:hypothetical protein